MGKSLKESIAIAIAMTIIIDMSITIPEKKDLDRTDRQMHIKARFFFYRGSEPLSLPNCCPSHTPFYFILRTPY